MAIRLGGGEETHIGPFERDLLARILPNRRKADREIIQRLVVRVSCLGGGRVSCDTHKYFTRGSRRGCEATK